MYQQVYYTKEKLSRLWTLSCTLSTFSHLWFPSHQAPFLVGLLGKQALSSYSLLQAASKHGLCRLSTESFLTKVINDPHPQIHQHTCSNPTAAFLVEVWLQLLLLCSASPRTFLPLTRVPPLHFIHQGHFAPSPVNSQCPALRRILRLPRLSGRQWCWTSALGGGWGGAEHASGNLTALPPPPGLWPPAPQALFRETHLLLQFQLLSSNTCQMFSLRHASPLTSRPMLQTTQGQFHLLLHGHELIHHQNTLFSP